MPCGIAKNRMQPLNPRMLTAADVVHIIVNVAEVAAKQLLLNMPSLEGPWAADEKSKQQLLQLQLVVVAKFQTYWQPCLHGTLSYPSGISWNVSSKP